MLPPLLIDVRYNHSQLKPLLTWLNLSCHEYLRLKITFNKITINIKFNSVLVLVVPVIDIVFVLSDSLLHILCEMNYF